MRRASLRLVVLWVVLAAALISSCSPARFLGPPGSPTPSPLAPSAEATSPPPTPAVGPPDPTPQDRAANAQPTPTPCATPTAAPLPTRVLPASQPRVVLTPDRDPTAEGEQIAETSHFTFYARAGSFPAIVPDLPEQAEIIFDDVIARFGTSPDGRTPVSFRPPSSVPCPPRGLASSNPPRIIIFADDGISREQILGVLAHEIGHIVVGARFDRVPRALNEGLATWASAPYFNAWLGHASLDAAVTGLLADGSYLPLHENYFLTDIGPGTQEGSSEACIGRRETLYTEWASFLGYLLEHHGMDKLESLILTAPRPEMTEMGLALKRADFQGVYGSSLNQLEATWLRELTNR